MLPVNQFGMYFAAPSKLSWQFQEDTDPWRSWLTCEQIGDAIEPMTPKWPREFTQEESDFRDR